MDYYTERDKNKQIFEFRVNGTSALTVVLWGVKDLF